MRRVVVVLGVPLSTLAFAVCVWGAPAMDAYHVVCSRQALSAGEQVEVRLEPAPPSGTYIYWRNAQQIGMNPAAAEAGKAVYTAPFVIRPGSPPAEIRVALSGAQTGRVEFIGRVDLVPSVLPLSADCLAADQTYSSDHGTIEPDGSTITRAEGVVVHMSDAEYPKVAVRRGLTDVVPVRVLLCTSGRVLAAYPQTSYDDNRQPIDHERILTEAAVAVASSRTFAPLLRDGTPAAGWIYVDVAFRQ